MKRQNMLEGFIVLVSGPDCFSRVYCMCVCVCVSLCESSSVALWVLCHYREQ